MAATGDALPAAAVAVVVGDAAAAGELAAAVAVLPVIPFIISSKKPLFCWCTPSALAKAIKAKQIEVNVDTFIFFSTFPISDLWF